MWGPRRDHSSASSTLRNMVAARNWTDIAHRALLLDSSLGRDVGSGDLTGVLGDPLGERLWRNCPRRVRVRPVANYVAHADAFVRAKSSCWKIVGGVGWSL